MTRADLARATRLAKQTVSNIIEELEREGMVTARTSVREGRGKPAIPYALAPDGAFSIGLHIDRHIARAVIVDLRGEPLVRRHVSLPSTPDAGLPILLDLIRCVREEASGLRPDLERRLVGLGVAMPGPFGNATSDSDENFGMAPWQRYPVVERLALETCLDVIMQNDAAAATTAEMIGGQLHGVRNAVCIYLGYGLGAGIVFNGELYTGRDGNAGEIGLIPTPPGASESVLEHHVSLASLCRHLGIAPSAPDLYERLDTAISEQPFEEWMRRAAQDSHWLVHMLDLIFSPERIVLAGSAPESIMRRLFAAMQSVHTKGGAAFVLGSANPWSVAQGAASDPIRKSFSPRYSALFKTIKKSMGS